MKKIVFFLLFIFCALFIFAQDDTALDGNVSDEITEEEIQGRTARQRSESPVMRNNIYVGLGPEVNAYTRKGAALGGILQIGYEFDLPIDAGIRTSFFNDLKTVNVLEIQPFFRYNLPWVKGLFAEADAGVMIAFEHGNSFLAFAGGAASGYRLNIDKYYIDFGARFGYPHMWAVNIIGGIKIQLGGEGKEPGKPRTPRSPRERGNTEDAAEDAGGGDE